MTELLRSRTKGGEVPPGTGQQPAVGWWKDKEDIVFLTSETRKIQKTWEPEWACSEGANAWI